MIEIPPKRHLRTTISYLDHDEITALLRAPGRTTWLGRRDHALLLVAIQTGLRVSELADLCIGDVSLGTGAHCKVIGKGRKTRTAPLTKETVAVLRIWLQERGGDDPDPVFPTRRGGPLTPIAWLLDKHTPPQPTAARRCAPSA